jgi:hypothetical protein
MIKETDLKRAVVNLLKEKYRDPPHSYYGVEVTEGYKKPAFLVDVRLRGMSDETANIVSKQYDVTIVHFPKKVRETEYLAMVDDIAALLARRDRRKGRPCMTLKVGDRYIGVHGYAYDYVGKKRDLLQIEWSMSFNDFAEMGPSGHEIMKYMDMKEQ